MDNNNSSYWLRLCQSSQYLLLYSSDLVIEFFKDFEHQSLHENNRISKEI